MFWPQLYHIRVLLLLIIIRAVVSDDRWTHLGKSRQHSHSSMWKSSGPTPCFHIFPSLPLIIFAFPDFRRSCIPVYPHYKTHTYFKAFGKQSVTGVPSEPVFNHSICTSLHCVYLYAIRGAQRPSEELRKKYKAGNKAVGARIEELKTGNKAGNMRQAVRSGEQGSRRAGMETRDGSRHGDTGGITRLSVRSGEQGSRGAGEQESRHGDTGGRHGRDYAVIAHEVLENKLRCELLRLLSPWTVDS